MALQGKVIKTKIKSVGNVKKITQAMEKVAAVKMRQIVARTLAAREYSFHTYELLNTLVGHTNLRHEFFNSGKGDKTLLIAISSNRGLCGNLNTQLGKTIASHIENHPDSTFEMITVGKKMEKVGTKLKIKLLASFSEVPEVVYAKDILPIVDLIKKEYRTRAYKKVLVAYSHYASALSFMPIVAQILPIQKKEIRSVMEKLFKNRVKSDGSIEPKFTEAIFEPGDKKVLDFVLPKILEVKIYKMLLESRACEQSARMMAMKNASENAEVLIEDLFVSYNRARQDGITKEISEVVAGAAN